MCSHLKGAMQCLQSCSSFSVHTIYFRPYKIIFLNNDVVLMHVNGATWTTIKKKSKVYLDQIKDYYITLILGYKKEITRNEK